MLRRPGLRTVPAHDALFYGFDRLISPMNQPRILQVSGVPVFDLGGVGKVVQWLAGDLSKYYRISLASPDAEWSGMPEELASCLENRISIPHPDWNQPDKERFLKQIKAGRHDLIHFHGGTFAFNAHLPWRSPLHRLCLAGVPWVFTNHCAPSFTEGLFPPRYPRAKKFLKSVLAWSSKCFLLAFCRQEVFASDENRAQIDRWFPWAKTKMRTIYNSGLEGSPPRSVLSPEVVTIANLGHIGWRKGQHDLLSAFILARQKFSRLRLVLAGPQPDGDYVRRMRDEISLRKLEASVEMPGGLTNKTAFWQAVDIYVQPSLYEGAPMALMEALWLGKPAIGTRVSGIPEIIEDNVSGLLVAPGKPAEMAAAIERLVVESDTRRRFSEQAAAHIQARGMTRKEMSRHYADLYNRILAKSRLDR
jgi:glycosyltransferase involved in cell wall biosynthesis